MSHISSSVPSAFSKLSPLGRGYLAFPAGLNLSPEQKVKNLKSYLSSTDSVTKTSLPDSSTTLAAELPQNESLETAWKERLEFELERRRLIEEREREEALRGEKEWVRSGGVLRDSDGRRDHQRTAEIKKLVEEEEAQKRALARWNTYEETWRKINSSSDSITFQSMPWPLVEKPQTPNDLRDASAIAKFLFETLGIKGSSVTRKDRLRSSLLRWHPDKLGGLLNRVPEDGLSAVKDGIDAVVMSLMSLQDTEKAERS